MKNVSTAFAVTRYPGTSKVTYKRKLISLFTREQLDFRIDQLTNWLNFHGTNPAHARSIKLHTAELSALNAARNRPKMIAGAVATIAALFFLLKRKRRA